MKVATPRVMMNLRLCFVGLLLVDMSATPAFAQDYVIMGAAAGSSTVTGFPNIEDGFGSFSAYDRSFTGGVRVALGDVDGDGWVDLITAAGPGGGPHVKVFKHGVAELLASFYAYSPSFTGGVFVAAGDVDGDGRADIITGAGAGGGPHVNVFSGKDLSVLASFYAYNPAFTGGVHVAAGDINGDGHADIITGAGPGGGPHVNVFSGKDLSVLASFFAYAPVFNGGVFVASGDFDADGLADIVTGAGPGGGPHVRILSGANLSQLASFYAYDPAFTGGVSVGVWYNWFFPERPDRPQLITGAGPGGGPHVQIFSPDLKYLNHSFYAFVPSFTGGVFVASLPGISAAIRIRSVANATFTVGAPGTFQATAAGGAGSVTFTERGALPPGVTFTQVAENAALLAGTPGAGTAGIYSLSVTATDGNGRSDTQDFTLVVR